MGLVRWEATLADLEARLDSFERGVADQAGAAELPSWAPPEDLPPLPPVLRGRAARLVERLRAASDRAAGQITELRGEHGRLDRRRRAGNAYAAAAPTGPGVKEL